jgi:hypothetical protein
MTSYIHARANPRKKIHLTSTLNKPDAAPSVEGLAHG